MERSLGVVIPAYRPDVDVLAGYVAEIHDALSPEVIRVELDSPAPGVRESLEGLTLEVGAVAERRGKGRRSPMGSSGSTPTSSRSSTPTGVRPSIRLPA